MKLGKSETLRILRNGLISLPLIALIVIQAQLVAAGDYEGHTVINRAAALLI